MALLSVVSGPAFALVCNPLPVIQGSVFSVLSCSTTEYLRPLAAFQSALCSLCSLVAIGPI